MELETIVKLPVTILAEIVSCADGLGDAVQALENLNSEWAVIERVQVLSTDEPDGSDVPPSERGGIRTFRFGSREEMVQHMEKSHIDPDVEVIAALKNGIPRNVTVKVQVQFR